MKRRQFIVSTALTAIAFSASGFVRFNGVNFEGDCETTTDILGPFYRPESPVRSNLIIPGDSGLIVELSGTIKHNDCITPYKNAKIELWHCDSEGVYDNMRPFIPNKTGKQFDEASDTYDTIDWLVNNVDNRKRSRCYKNNRRLIIEIETFYYLPI